MLENTLSVRRLRQFRAVGGGSRRWVARTRQLWLTLLVRGFGGLAGVLPPFIAILMVDRTQYGLASANFALALLLTGPINQYVQQGYLRDILAVRIQGTGRRPAGTAVIYLYYVLSVVGLVIATACGLPWWTSVFTGVLTLLAIGMRMQENHLVIADRQKTAVTAFYILPPVLLCIGMVLFKLVLPISDFMVVSMAQLFAYGISLALSCLSRDAPATDLLPPPLPRGREAWMREFRPVRVYFGNGVLLGAAEQAPTLLLRWLGLPFAIPAFEIARKAASVPALVGHACSMQLSPKLVTAAENRAWPAFESTMKTYCGLMLSVSVAYMVGLVALAAVVGRHLAITEHLEYGVTAVLLGSALITTVAAPFGSAIVALRGESWLLYGPAISLVLQIVISFTLFNSLGTMAIAIAVAAQNGVSSAVVVVGMVVILRHQKAASA